MKKIGKRFMALLIAFASIMSFIPIKFGGSAETANAAESNKVTIGSFSKEYYSSPDCSNSAITFSGEDSNGKVTLTGKPGDSDNLYLYDDTQGHINYYMTWDDVSINADDLEKEIKEAAQNKYQEDYNNNKVSGNYQYSVTAVTKQTINLVSINQIKVDENSSSWNQAATDLGISISDDVVQVNGKDKIRKTINGLPFGRDSIVYRLDYNITTITYNAITKKLEKNTETKKQENYTAQINNGSKFVVSEVESLFFDQYIGTKRESDITDPQLSMNNTNPFLIESIAEPDEGMPMKYTWNVPYSAEIFKYYLKLKSLNDDSSPSVYVKGKKDEAASSSSSDNTIVGELSDFSGTSNYIVVKTSAGVERSISIEISYPKKLRDDDYSINDAGISKEKFNDDDSVKAYIGKKFNHKIVTNGSNKYDEYEGTITIDPNAGMISLKPTFVAGESSYDSSDDISLEISNSFTSSNDKGIWTNTYHLGSSGDSYIDPYHGDIDNTLNLSVYKKDSNGRKLVAIYHLKVVKPDDDQLSEYFNMKLQFDGDQDDETYLTPEGAEKTEVIQFKPSLQTYSLYTKDKGKVIIGLETTTDKNEYIKVFTSDSTTGSTYNEVEDSKTNLIDPSTGRREKNEIVVNFGDAKRILVQAYYDKVKQQEDGSYTLVDTYTVGKQYTFFIPDNITESDDDNTTKSDDASLMNIKVKGETIYDENGNKGFNSDVYNYTVTVPKGQETATVTITPQDDNVKSIVATVAGTDTSYNIISGEETELQLNSSGITELQIEVTAQNGKDTKIYTLVIKNNKKGNSTKLKDLILSSGDFKFDPDELTTKVQVESSVNSIFITPVAEDSKAKITVNGQKFTGKPVKISLAGKQTTEVDIEVESEDGESTTTYTLKIKRTDTNYGDKGDEGITEDIFYDRDNECWVDTSKYDEWGVINNRVMYFDKRGRQVKDRWINTGRKWYYINEAGYRATGWKVDNETGQRYYMDNTTGEMKYGMMYLNGSWYYLGTTGVMHTGWLWLNNNWYYFTENGEMITNQSMVIDGKEYRFATDGRIY